jgi:CTP:molybdopterin cytidylyltransferase MocA
MHIIALIPAAGKGSRFGMPKVDALYNSISFSRKVLLTLQKAGIKDSILIRDIDTPDMLSSIRWGMKKALSEIGTPDGWLIWPVDHPTVSAETILTLTSEFEQKNNAIIIPCHNSRNGHPIILPGFFTIPEENNPIGLKGVILLSHIPIEYVEVDDPGILHNINTPEDVLNV